MNIHRTIFVLLLIAPALLPRAARAETYETCAGFIDSVPTTITTQGVWCLRKNLATSIASGKAITIATNNVTIDCNGFKLGGLAAGENSEATGIYSIDRHNATVRHCNVRGFRTGIYLHGGTGHLIEDNRLDNNLFYGIIVDGENNLVQRNRVFDTGGYPDTFAYGIYAFADIIDNTISGVFAGATDSNPRGIMSFGPGHEVRGNRVRGLVVSGAGSAYGILTYGATAKITGNWISAEATTSGTGIHANGAYTACTDNVVANFSFDYVSCDASLDNIGLP